MLDDVAFPLTNGQITEFILEREYTDYFTIQQSFYELTEDKLITIESIRNSSHCTITEEGIRTLTYYRHIITDEVIESIRSYMTEHKIELKNKVSVLAHYEPLRDGEYSLHFHIKERGRSIIDLTVQAPTEELANKMCDSWQEKHEQLYAYIMTNLLPK